MKNILSFFCVACIFSFVVASCSRPDHVGSPLSSDLPILTVTQAIEPSRLGKVVQVRGDVHEVCQDEGCWMTVIDSVNGLRVTFDGASFVVPMDLQGTVVVQGTVSEEIYSEEDAKLLAETLGWDSSEISNIKGDTRIPLMTATGVRFESR
ncbi:MAG: DUF4920 domain-containing protein [Bradyrhizobiaceae bacterium]|nr:DUF4920 domain-containing protein [Bradyrhizobiaceae bacterium]